MMMAIDIHLSIQSHFIETMANKPDEEPEPISNQSTSTIASTLKLRNRLLLSPPGNIEAGVRAAHE